MSEQGEWSKESVEKQVAEAEKAPPVEPVDPPQAEKTEETQEAKELVRAEKVVPLGALDKEKARRRAAEAKASQIEQQLQTLQRQQQEVMARLEQKQEPQAPDPAVDPAGAILHEQKLTREQLERVQRQQWEEQQRVSQQQQWNQFVASVKADEAEFAKEQPDVNDAIGFLKNSRAKQYEAMGMTHDEVMRQVNQDELNFIVTAKQRGENPAEVGYRMAQAAGYVSPAKKLAMQKEGQGAGLPSGGGGKGGGLPSYESLLKMSKEDFAKATQGDQWRKLMNR